MTLGCFVKRGNVPLPARTETITSLQEFHARTDCHHPHRRHAGEFKSRATRWGRSCPTAKLGLQSYFASESQRDVLVQLLRSLRALAPDFQMSLEMGDRPVELLTRQQASHHIALRALGTLDRTNETAFMSNLELFDSMLPPNSLQSDNLLQLAKLDLANKDAPTALMQASAANIKNLASMAGACLRSRHRHSGAPVPAWFPEASWRFHTPLPAIFLSNHPTSGTSKQLQGCC